MRKAKVRDGIVAEIYDLPEEQFQALAGPGDTFVACSSEVCRGWLYADLEFWDPSAPVPAPTQPKSEAEVLADLDRLREQAVQGRISKWGSLSVEMLWPLLKADCETESSQGDSMTLEMVPSAVGYLQGTAEIELPTLEQVKDLLASVRRHQSDHVALLAKTEKIRNKIAAKYSELPLEERLDFSVDLEWAKALQRSDRP